MSKRNMVWLLLLLAVAGVCTSLLRLQRSEKTAVAVTPVQESTTSTPPVSQRMATSAAPVESLERGSHPQAPPFSKALKREPTLGTVLIRGRVADVEGSPLGGTRVLIWDADTFREKQPHVAETSADADGMYEIRPERWSEAFVIRAELSGYCPALVEARGEPGAELRRNLVLTRSESELEGRVVDPERRPLEGVRVSLSFRPASSQRFSNIPATLTTASDGTFAFGQLPSGQALLQIRRQGYETRTEGLSLRSGRNEVDFVLEAVPTFWITVRNAQGQPVPRPRAGILTRGNPQLLRLGDENGLIDLPIDRIRLPFECDVSAAGYLNGKVLVDKEGGRADVVLEDGPLFSGLVRTRSGVPLEGATVTAYCRSPFPLTQSGRTDPAGNFAIRLGCTEVLSVAVRRTGYLPARLTASTIPSLRNAVIELEEPRAGVSGQVVDASGAPVPYFVVHVRSLEPDQPFSADRSFSDPNGRFAILDLPAGTMEMTFVEMQRDPSGSPARKMFRFELDLPEGRIQDNIEIRLTDAKGRRTAEQPRAR